jgi:hypothetical protein
LQAASAAGLEQLWFFPPSLMFLHSPAHIAKRNPKPQVMSYTSQLSHQEESLLFKPISKIYASLHLVLALNLMFDSHLVP